MKTVYTDRYAIRLWIFAFLTVSMGYKGLAEENGWFQILAIMAAAYWAYSALKEFRRRQNARKSGADPSVYKVVDNAPNQ